MKVCSKCGLDKDESQFNKHRNTLGAYCKDCRKSYYLENKLKIQARAKITGKVYNDINREKRNLNYKRPEVRLKQLVSAANRYAAKLGIPGIITEKEISDLILESKLCRYCNIDILELWSIDHIIPTSNPQCINTIDNINILCYPCNRAKRAKSHFQFVCEILKRN